VSDYRNRLIQKMFQLAGAGDQAGSGVPRIYGVWKAQSWREPIAYEKREPDQTLFELRMASLLPEEEVQKLEDKYGERFRGLTHNDKVVVVSAALESTIDHKRVCELTGQHPADVTKQLGKLVREKLLIPDGRGRGTFYWSAEADRAAFYGFEEPRSLPGLEESLPGLEESLPDLEASSPALRPLAAIEHLRKLVYKHYPSGLPRKLPEEEVRSLILTLLRDDFVTLRDLAAAMERSNEFIRYNYLRPLISQGLVLTRYSNASHPEQAYKAATSSGDAPQVQT
jgi:ATP-dependent DNA helicase RecG